MSEIKPNPVKVEDGIHSSLWNFFIAGLAPGSYTSYMLMHEFDRAKLSAHPHLKNGHPNLINAPHDEMSAHDCLVYVFRDLPDFMTGDNFKLWKGYLNISYKEQQEIRAPYTNEKLREYQTYRILNGYSEVETFYKWIQHADSIITNNRRNSIV